MTPPANTPPPEDEDDKKGKKGKKEKKGKKGNGKGRTQRPNAFSPSKARQARSHPAADAAVRMLPPRQYEIEQNGTPIHDGFGLVVTTANPLVQERFVELLRFLGRVYVADTNTLFRMLYYRRFDLRTTHRDLKMLVEQRLVWSATSSGIGPKMKANRLRHWSKVYGLSRAGKQLLMNMGVETDVATAEQLVARDVRGGKVPKPSSLAHDLQVTWWCASMIEGLRLLPWCTGIYCQTELTVIQGQRPDAYLVARFDVNHPRPDVNAIPWIGGTPLRPNEIELRWALELDNSTESVNILVDKFITYRDLHAMGTYQRVLGGDVLLVLIVQNARRAAYLAAEFTRAWPQGWGLVSTPDRMGANSTPYGALWGTYFDMNSEQRVPLLSRLCRDAQQRVDEYAPLLTYELWLKYLALQKAGTPPTKIDDLFDDKEHS